MSRLTIAEFEDCLSELCEALTRRCGQRQVFANAHEFESAVRIELIARLGDSISGINPDPHPHAFPDIVVGSYGIEVKFTTSDSWRSIANSVFETTRDRGVERIFIIYGKMGGEPCVDWDHYENCVIHVRASHVPRFEIQLHPAESLFEKIGVTYEDFVHLGIPERMAHIRKYARGRLKPGERLWWLEDDPDAPHTLPIQARLYMSLQQNEKRRLRAEAAVLCPQVVKPSRSKHKYDDAVLYLLTYHGVLCPQARDLFSAGSVAMRRDTQRGGNYVLRALLDIEQEMRQAFVDLEDDLFREYWGCAVAGSRRVGEWLRRADLMAVDWRPSRHLFRGG